MKFMPRSENSSRWAKPRPTSEKLPASPAAVFARRFVDSIPLKQRPRVTDPIRTKSRRRGSSSGRSRREQTARGTNYPETAERRAMYLRSRNRIVPKRTLAAAAVAFTACENYPGFPESNSSGDPEETEVGGIVSSGNGFAEVLIQGRTFVNGNSVRTVTYGVTDKKR